MLPGRWEQRAANTQKQQAKEEVTVLQQMLQVLIINVICNAHDSPSSIQYKILHRTAWKRFLGSQKVILVAVLFECERIGARLCLKL